MNEESTSEPARSARERWTRDLRDGEWWPLWIGLIVILVLVGVFVAILIAQFTGSVANGWGAAVGVAGLAVAQISRMFKGLWLHYSGIGITLVGIILPLAFH